MKRGLGAHPLLKSDIELAQTNTLSAASAARYLNVAYNTYRKWAIKYGIFKTNQRNEGIKKVKHGPNYQERILQEVLDGRRPNFNRFRLKTLLIRYGYLHEECCMHHPLEKRLSDGKMPLILHFKDGNKKNFKHDNLELLCYNCYFFNVGNIPRHKIDLLY